MKKTHLLHSKDKTVLGEITDSGGLAKLIFSKPDATGEGKSHEVKFREDGFAGPSICGVLLAYDPETGVFNGRRGDLRVALRYGFDQGAVTVGITVKNTGTSPFSEKLRLQLGIDTEMIAHPDWNEILFPTLLRCEKTHAWGYFMSPRGVILAWCSQEPVASWGYEYEPFGHRIRTVYFDLIHRGPLPERHPRGLDTIQPGQALEWNFRFKLSSELENIQQDLSQLSDAPFIQAGRTQWQNEHPLPVRIFSRSPVKLELHSPKGEIVQRESSLCESDSAIFSLSPGDEYGAYKVLVENVKGLRSEAMFYRRAPWSYYLRQAREAAAKYQQKASTHMESWLGHFSATSAARYFPETVLDEKLEENYQQIFPLMFDLEAGVPIIKPERIQNTYMAISLLVDRFQRSKNFKELEQAARLGDWLVEMQSEDGAFRSKYLEAEGLGVHYTCVAYGAKSMLELAAAEAGLARREDGEIWKQRFERHYGSAMRAVTDLAQRRDDIETEGQMTFEDGMISCSATQLALAALWQKDANQRDYFYDAAKYMFSLHRCLDQAVVPDCRMRGGTLRFWEAQYDVMIPTNMMNSPHGWTAWRIPGFIYMYWLSLDTSWLHRAMDALSASVQLVDLETGDLRWSFTQDPYIKTKILQRKQGNNHKETAEWEPVVFGESYVPMISDFYLPEAGEATGGHWDPGGCCDNDVHEIFKALDEVVLAIAYIYETDDGSLRIYNGRLEGGKDDLVRVKADSCVSAIHFNLKSNATFEFDGMSKLITRKQNWWDEPPAEIFPNEPFIRFCM